MTTLTQSLKDTYPAIRKFVPRKSDLLPSVFLILIYIATAKLTLILLPPAEIAPALIWPPAGIALAFMYLFGYRMAAATAVAAALSVWSGGAPITAIIIGTLANTLFPITGAYIMRKVDFGASLSRLRDTYTILIVSSFATIVLPLTIFVLQWITGTLQSGDLTSRFVRIWGGIAFSAIILAPLLIAWIHDWRLHLTRRQFFEFLAALGTLIAASTLVFLTPYAQALAGLVFLVILLPHLWLSIRFEPKYSTLALFLMAAISITGVILNVSNSPNPIGQRLYTVELFLVFLAFIFLILASLVEERRKAAAGLKAHIDKLEDALKIIRAQDAAKTEFLAVLAHELRNPLAPIVSALELLNMKGIWQSDTGTFTLIDDHVKTMRRLLDDLLDIARISQNKLQLQKERTDVCAVSQSAITSIKKQLEDRGQTVLFDRPPEAIIIDADPIRIEQVFRNLLSNASKFSEHRASISFSILKKDDTAEIRIKDSGVGIAPTMLTKIFEPFLQINHGGRNNEGIGVGLSIVKRIVEIHGGTTEARSDGVGMGSEFVVSLPLATGEAMAAAPEERSGMFALPARASILVVDDNEPAAHSLGKLLELMGHSVQYAYTGEGAVQAVVGSNPSIVILDIGLPDISGYDAAKKIRNAGFRGTLIALTGYGQAEDKQRSFEAGYDHHIVKPVGINELQAVLVIP